VGIHVFVMYLAANALTAGFEEKRSVREKDAITALCIFKQ